MVSLVHSAPEYIWTCSQEFKKGIFWDSLEILSVTIGGCIKFVNHFVTVELCLIPDALIPDIC